MKKLDAIQQADKLVDITDTCRLVGMDVHDSMKLQCPFPMFHSDGGHSPTFRIYPETNSAYCFRCREGFGPVKLYAKAHGISFSDSAHALLRHVNYSPVSMHERFMTNLKPPAVDTDALYESLLLFASTLPQWSRVQYLPEVIGKLDRCREALRYVETGQAATDWSQAARVVLADVCGRAVGVQP